MTIEYTIHLSEEQLKLLSGLVENRVYELRYEVNQRDSQKDFWLTKMQHYYSLLRSGEENLVSWNSMIGGAYPPPIEPAGWREWLKRKNSDL